MNQGFLIVPILAFHLRQQIPAVLPVRTKNVWHEEKEYICNENPSSPFCVCISLKMFGFGFFFQEADLLSGNPGYTDPGIQVEEFSTVTSGKR